MESDQNRKRLDFLGENNFGSKGGRFDSPSERGMGGSNLTGFADGRGPQVGEEGDGFRGNGGDGRMSPRGGGFGHGRGGGFDHGSGEGDFLGRSGFAQSLGGDKEQNGFQKGIVMESDEPGKKLNSSGDNNFGGEEVFDSPSETGRGGGNLSASADGGGDFKGGQWFGDGQSGQRRGFSPQVGGEEDGFRGQGGFGRGGDFRHGRGGGCDHGSEKGDFLGRSGFAQRLGGDNEQDGFQKGIGMESDEHRKRLNSSRDNNFGGEEGRFDNPAETGRGGGNLSASADSRGDFTEGQSDFSVGRWFGDGQSGQRGGCTPQVVGEENGFRGRGGDGRLSPRFGFGRGGDFRHGGGGECDHGSRKGDFLGRSGFAQRLGGNNEQDDFQKGIVMEFDERGKRLNSSRDNNFGGEEGRFDSPSETGRGGGNFSASADGRGDLRKGRGVFSVGRWFGDGQSGQRGGFSPHVGVKGDRFRSCGGEFGFRGHGGRGRTSPRGGFGRGGGFDHGRGNVFDYGSVEGDFRGRSSFEHGGFPLWQDGNNKEDGPLKDFPGWNAEVVYKMLDAVYWNTVGTTFWPTVSSFLHGRETDEIKAIWGKLTSELKPPTFNTVLDNTKRLLMETVIMKNPKIEGLPESPGCVFHCYADSQNVGETLKKLSKSELCEKFKSMNALEKARYRVDHATNKKEFDLTWFKYYKEHPEKFQELSKLSVLNS